MSKTKVIEVNEGTQMIMQIGTDTKGRVETVMVSADDLETLNSTYVNEHFRDLQETAYQKGYDTGIIANSFIDKSDEAYQKGLDDAWWAARKIFGYEKDSGIPIKELRKIFGYAEDTLFYTVDIIRHNNAAEAIKKIKEYEEKKDMCRGCVWEGRYDGDCAMCSNNYLKLYKAKENGVNNGSNS